jgi:hypothetical protein
MYSTANSIFHCLFCGLIYDDDEVDDEARGWMIDLLEGTWKEVVVDSPEISLDGLRKITK